MSTYEGLAMYLSLFRMPPVGIYKRRQVYKQIVNVTVGKYVKSDIMVTYKPFSEYYYALKC